MRIATILAMLLTSAMVTADVQAQQDLANDPARLAWQNIPSVLQCGRCHAGGGDAFFDSDFVRLVELREWLLLDKHAIARRLIEPLPAGEIEAYRARLTSELGVERIPDDWVGASNVLSYEMTERLGWDVTTDAGYATFRDNCLTCHGGYDGSAPQQALFARQGEQQQPGIACTHCHGSIDAEWVNEHDEAAWRAQSAAEKAELGNIPIADPVTQASTCFDCHVGNLEQNRFVTHAMYAAGHPPLPGVELETFCESLQQPRSDVSFSTEVLPHHWRPLETLPDFSDRDAYLAATFPQLYARQTKPAFESVGWNTRKVVIGALVAKQHQLRLLAAAAESQNWGDYALYDCAACHHPLYWPSPRQRRGYLSRYDRQRQRPPGRPRLPEWPDVMLNAFLAAVNAAEIDRDATLKLEQAMDATPFGEANRVRSAASEAADALDGAIAKAQALPFGAEHSSRLLKFILQEATAEEGRLLEFNAARQVVWFLIQLTTEVNRLDSSRLPPQFTAGVEELGQLIPLELPAGRNQRISRDLGSSLAKQNQYDAVQLDAALRRLGELL